ncbi:M48 family metalloprotease [Collimonas sp. NPDC087041]|uniref:M48 family metalloprotease n=1 Tax=Collimonas sp. NPDC087041 TaxID=3363960 RepID=UPI003828BD8F
MNPSQQDRSALTPLDYHVTVANYLRHNEPEVWQWASSRTSRSEQLDSLRAVLLRDTYRIDPQAHGDVHAILNTAMDRLGINVPATLYQASGQEMNATLYYVPGEVHIIAQGALLERLSNDELLAVFGHELAHYLLWSHDDGSFLVAERILADAVAVPGSAASLSETYRRYRLYTELFADRGGAVACGAVAPAISSLVKVTTGISTVDSAAYLRQVEEIESNETAASDARSHPEAFIRARALDLWWNGSADLGRWLDLRLHGPLMLESLDLPGQIRLQQLTRGFLSHYLTDSGLASDAVLAQIRMMFPDWSTDEPTVGPQAFSAEHADNSIRDYLNALMLDLALADADQQDVALLRAGRIAQELGSLERLLQNLRRDVGFGKRELDRYKRQLDKEISA